MAFARSLKIPVPSPSNNELNVVYNSTTAIFTHVNRSGKCQLWIMHLSSVDHVPRLIQHYIIPSSAGPTDMWDMKYISPVPTDGLAPNCAWPSAGTVVTIKMDIFFSIFSILSKIWFIFYDDCETWHVLQWQTRPYKILCHFRVLLQAKASDISMSLFVRNDTGLYDIICITYHKTGTTMLYDTHFNYRISRYEPILGKHPIDGLAQDCVISSALAVEILKSCINRSEYHVVMIHIWIIFFCHNMKPDHEMINDV